MSRISWYGGIIFKWLPIDLLVIRICRFS